MVFTSPIFLFLFIPLFFCSYSIAGEKYRNYIALIGSLLFYWWGAPKFVYILLISILFDWYLGNLIFQDKERNIKKIYLFLSTMLNICLLCYFKYYNFFIENINHVLIKLQTNPLEHNSLLLPLGLSFVVFQKISYVVDIYRNVVNPAQKIQDYFLYILLFPKLLAGPIVKYKEIDNQIRDRKYSLDDFIEGVCLFSKGLGKKVLLADTLGVVVDIIFKIPTDTLSITYAWLGMILFAMQIYFDFSGYTDMALGIAKIMGFDLPQNFNMPYISKNFTEFWRRWHITLSSWMRDYLYIPLGGNKCSRRRTLFNLWIVFLVSGFWHGANWTFVCWGIYHGLFLMLDKIFWLDFSRNFPKVINIAITFFLVMIGWVIFRSENIVQAVHYIFALFGANGFQNANSQQTIFSNSTKVAFMASIFIVFLPSLDAYAKFENKSKGNFVKYTVSLLLILLSFIKISSTTFNPFIYLRF